MTEYSIQSGDEEYKALIVVDRGQLALMYGFSKSIVEKGDPNRPEHDPAQRLYAEILDLLESMPNK